MVIVKDDQEATLTNLPRRYGVDDIPLILQTKQMEGNEVQMTSATNCSNQAIGSCAQNNDERINY
jgi:hypothetical protein